MRVLVTGGAGFMGSNFIRHILRQHPTYEVVNFDKLTYAGNLENLADVEQGSRYRFVKADVCDRAAVEEAISAGVDAVINFAAESHVDRSISDPAVFMRTNVLGTQVLLDVAVAHKVGRFIQISTDEVYGALGREGKFTEGCPLKPNSPYAASKAAADLLVRSYWMTYGYGAIITRSSNNYGPYQFPEKFVPLAITNCLEGKPIPVYGDGLYVRHWLYVDDHSAAVDLVLQRGVPGEIYNVGGACEQVNVEVAKKIVRALGCGEGMIAFVKDRPGHDRRYAMSTDRLRRELGWAPAVPFEEGLGRTIAWYREHRSWWEKIKSGEYRQYYERMYGGR